MSRPLIGLSGLFWPSAECFTHVPAKKNKDFVAGGCLNNLVSKLLVSGLEIYFWISQCITRVLMTYVLLIKLILSPAFAELGICSLHSY